MARSACCAPLGPRRPARRQREAQVLYVVVDHAEHVRLSRGHLVRVRVRVRVRAGVGVGAGVGAGVGVRPRVRVRVRTCGAGLTLSTTRAQQLEDRLRASLARPST